MWLVTFGVDRHYNQSQVLVWIPFVIIKMVSCYICGVTIMKLYQQAHTDALTGLGNRKFFNAKLTELKRKGPVSLLLIDLDNFKKVNDTYGHMTGDHVLRELAAIFQSGTRKNDVIARWGGEEFAVILPQTNAGEAVKIAERIRTMVENRLFTHDKNTCRVTVSVGIASTDEGVCFRAEQFLRAADEALCKAKKKKNYVITG